MRRIASAAIAGAALLVAFGCGAGGNDTSVRSGTHGASAVHAADSVVDANGLRTVTYHGVQFDVPADWPVYDLAADPTTCVRFDVHAVYLGHPGADMNCPARSSVGPTRCWSSRPTAGRRPSRVQHPPRSRPRR